MKIPYIFGTPRLRAGLAVLALGIALAGCGAANTSSVASNTPIVSLSPAPAAGSLTPGTQAATLQQSYINVVNRVSPSVVEVETDQGLGSGIVFDGNGDIVTNNHVIAGGTNLQVVLTNGKHYPATVKGTFAEDDLAVIHINATGLVPATFADSSKLQVGDLVLAIGNPLGLSSSVTDGIISALGRTVTESQSGTTLTDVVQTSAPINPGNSGGALVDLNGNVVGIPTLGLVDQQLGGAAAGIGFAIPSNTVRNIATQLVQSGTVTNSGRAYLGIQAQTLQQGNGVYVVSVIAGKPAAMAGIKAGDIITSLDGQTVTDTQSLSQILANLKPGQTVSVVVTLTDGSSKTFQVTLGEYPG